MAPEPDFPLTAPIARPLFDGTRQVSALWFDPALLGEREAQRRVIANWCPQAKLFRLFGGYLLQWPQARQHACAELDGLPLIDIDGFLSSAPLSLQERASAHAGSVWLIAGARADVAVPGTAQRIDPSIWVDVSQITLRNPLRLPQQPLAVTLPQAEPGKTLRQILGDKIPLPSKESEQFRQALAQAQGANDPAQRPGARVPGGPGQIGASAPGRQVGNTTLAGLAGVMGMRSLGLLGGLAGWLARMMGRSQAGVGPGANHAGQGVGTGAGAGAGGYGAGQGAGRADGKPSSWATLLNRFAVKMANLTQVSQLLGWRQANYLRKMMELFEQGDTMEALRHAIPLAADSDDNLDKQTLLGTPQARRELSVSAPGKPASVMHLQDALQEHLRQTYRRTFERLVREGKIDEAVFVLAELLKCGTEAVNFLESHGRFKQAAELAETLQLAPAMRVRLWWLAHEFERAARLAQSSQTFAEAVALLERSNQAQAAPLRQAWAEHLAARGELTDAVDVIWPLPEQRPQALQWLQLAEQAGGVPGVRAMCRKLLLLPQSLATSIPALDAILCAPGDEGVHLRARMADELLALKEHSDATRKLAGRLYRCVLPDSVNGKNRLDKTALERLLTLAAMPLLKADLPTFALPKNPPQQAGLHARTPALEVRLPENGLQAILDACILPSGHYLLALGEGGVIRINRQGKRMAHFAVPAHKLVIAQNGFSALALAKRDATWRISRIDLQRNSVADWLSLPLRFWATQYDGAIWNVVMHNRLLAIDTLQPQLATVWQVADLPGEIIMFDDDGREQTLLIASQDSLQQWRYMLPARRLNQRDPLPLPDSDVWQLLPQPGWPEPLKLYLMPYQNALTLSLVRGNRTAQYGQGNLIDPQTGQPLSGYKAKAAGSKGEEVRIFLGQTTQDPRLELRDGWLMIVVEADGQQQCLVAEPTSGTVRARLYLPTPSEARARLQDGHVLFFNLQGGLIDLEVATCQVVTLGVS
jgi:hypothetical protein